MIIHSGATNIVEAPISIPSNSSYCQDSLINVHKWINLLIKLNCQKKREEVILETNHFIERSGK
jgi:hypothetical protein